ncbi:hypothetical protein BC834DRAFT_848724, partial [Gloeopeniophorella convolvens]
LTVAALTEHDNTIWPHPLIAALGRLFYQHPDASLDGLDMSAIENKCHRYAAKGVLATIHLHPYVVNGPSGVQWWLPPLQEEEQVQMDEDHPVVPEPEPSAQDDGGDGEEEMEEDQAEETPQPAPAPRQPRRSARVGAKATGPVTAAVTAPPSIPIAASEDPAVLNTQYVVGKHINEVPKRHYNTNLCGPCNFAGLECVLQDYLQSSGAYSCVACKDAKIRCWPPSSAALGRLYDPEVFRRGQKKEELITSAPGDLSRTLAMIQRAMIVITRHHDVSVEEVFNTLMAPSSQPGPSGSSTSPTTLSPATAMARRLPQASAAASALQSVVELLSEAQL